MSAHTENLLSVDTALKLVLEPIFEAGFAPCSYGFRPRRRAMDAVAEIRLLASNSCEWVVDADIETVFDTKRSRIEWLELLSE